MRRLVVLAALSGPAMAQDFASWDGTGCVIRPVTGQAHVAEVTCRNVETHGHAFNEAVIETDVVAVHVAIIHEPGFVPDRFTLTALGGYVAVPGEISLDEYSSGVVKVFPWVGM